VRSDPRGGGVTLPEDAARWEANRADNERQRVRKQRRQLRSSARAVVRARRLGGTLFELGSSRANEEEGEDEEEREIISSPRSPSPESLLLPRDLLR
jgi:hypothetical protein